MRISPEYAFGRGSEDIPDLHIESFRSRCRPDEWNKPGALVGIEANEDRRVVEPARVEELIRVVEQ